MVIVVQKIMGRHGRVRLADVAKAAGVHPATASRALSADPHIAGAVHAGTRDLVSAAAVRLGYRPNRQGRALRTGRSLVLGLLVPRVSDTVLSAFYEGMLSESERSGYTVLVASTADRPERREARIEELIEHGVDGVLYTDAHLGESLPTVRDVPVIQAYRYSQPPGGIVADDRVGGEEVARHFLESGHHRFALLAGYRYASTTTDRAKGFLAELERGGVNIDTHVSIEYSGLTPAEGRRITERVLSTPDRPTAIFATDDYLAIGVVSGVHSCGLTAGKDVAVVGYSDLPLARELPIPLSSVAVPLADLGARAVESLLGVLSGEPPLSERVRPELRIRASSRLHVDKSPEAASGPAGTDSCEIEGGITPEIIER
jgi:LacI family transcriptional regulator